MKMKKDFPKRVKTENKVLDQENGKKKHTRSRKKGEKKRRKTGLTEESQKMIFTSTADPYETRLKWWEKEPIKYAITHPLVKSRLEMLMGSNVVRLTDRKYMLKLMSKIRQDHEAKQQIRIEERMKRELMRTKMMILNRFIPVQEAPEDIRNYPLFQLYLYCDALIEERRKKGTRKLIRIRDSLYRMLYPSEKDMGETEDDGEEEIYLKRIKSGKESEMIPLTNEEISEYLEEQEEKKDMEAGYTLNNEEFDRLHYETDAVRNLRKAKTVEELYAKAHEIVGILYSYADEGRYKKEKPDDKNEKEASEDGENEREREKAKEG